MSTCGAGRVLGVRRAPAALRSLAARRRSLLSAALAVRRPLPLPPPPRPRPPPTSQQQQQPQQAAEDLPPWVRRERERELAAAAGKKGLPWPLYLVFSCLVAIAAVGSIFEYTGRNPIFGVIQPDSPLWAPVLGLFALTGLPTAAFLFFKGVNAANEAAELQDRVDGYIK